MKPLIKRLCCLLGLLCIACSAAFAQHDGMDMRREQRFFDGKLWQQIDYDSLGRWIFWKEATGHGEADIHFRTRFYLADSSYLHEFNILFMKGDVSVLENRIFPRRSDSWGALPDVMLQPVDSVLDRANRSCRMEGYPQTRAELMAHPSVQAYIQGPRYRYGTDSLRADQQSYRTTMISDRGEIWAWNTYDYDSVGHQLRIQMYLLDEPGGYTDFIYHYDALGHMVERIDREAWDDGADTVRLEKNQYRSGRLSKSTVYHHKQWTRTETYTYDARGRLTRMETRYPSPQAQTNDNYYYTAGGLPERQETWTATPSGSRKRTKLQTWKFVFWD